MGSKPGVMSRIANEQLTEGPRESCEVLFQWTLTKSDNDQNLMLGVYLSIKTNSLTVKYISLFTVFDLSTPLRRPISTFQSPYVSTVTRSCLYVSTNEFITIDDKERISVNTSFAFTIHVQTTRWLTRSLANIPFTKWHSFSGRSFAVVLCSCWP